MTSQKTLKAGQSPHVGPAPAIWGAHKIAPEVRLSDNHHNAAKITHDMNHSLSIPLVFADYLATRGEPETLRLSASGVVKSLQTVRSMLLAFMQVSSATEGNVSGMLSGMLSDIRPMLRESRTFVQSTALRDDLPQAAAQMAALAMRHLDKADALLAQIQEDTSSRRKKAPVDVSSLLQHAIDMAARCTKLSGDSERFGFSCVVENSPSQVHGDHAALERLFSNMIANAIHAMPEGGEVRASVKNHGEFVLVRITDSGIGMDEHTASCVFQPFFTTKGENGTGLGLSIARDVIEGHGGEVAIKSAPGEGTTFRIALPAKR
ncbi:MAG: HAMP domain-containing sensor histidine kinase [Candidatus Micrarchaeota archaeon]